MVDFDYEIKQTLEKSLPDRLNIANWKGEQTTVEATKPQCELFYEQCTGYIYCICSDQNLFTTHALIIAFVDDYGEIKPMVQPSKYFIDPRWEGYKIVNPIEFIAKLTSIEKAYDKNELCWKFDQYLKGLIETQLIPETEPISEFINHHLDTEPESISAIAE